MEWSHPAPIMLGVPPSKLPLTGSPDALTQHNGLGLDHSIVHVHLVFQTDKLVHRGRSAHHELELGTLCHTNFPYLAKVVHLLHTSNQTFLSVLFTIIGCKHGVYYIYFFFNNHKLSLDIFIPCKNKMFVPYIVRS
jgi:hypothetical protein